MAEIVSMVVAATVVHGLKRKPKTRRSIHAASTPKSVTVSRLRPTAGGPGTGRICPAAAPSRSATGRHARSDQGAGLHGQLPASRWNGPIRRPRTGFSPRLDDATAITERNLFRLFLQGDRVPGFAGCEELLRFHLSIAKNRVAKAALFGTDLAGRGTPTGPLFTLYDDVEPINRQPLLHTEVNLARPGEVEAWYTLYASFYREGIFFTYAAADNVSDSLVALLARRDIVIRDLLKKRRPYLTELAVLVADLQDSVKICTELPPEEYFELINEVWGATEPKLRKYYATHGKHAGDGMVCYFFPHRIAVTP